MTTKGKVAIILLALTFYCCKGTQQTSASGDGAGVSLASSLFGGGTQTENVTDPGLNNMTAYSVTIPAKWHFQGVLLEGAGVGRCLQFPFGVWRATSPDGLSFVETMPTMSWIYGTGPMAGYSPRNGCLPLKGPMAAQDFLKYLAATMKVDYVEDQPIPEQNAKEQQELQAANAKAAAGWAAMHVPAPKTTVELAQAAVSYKNGTFAMKGRLWVRVNCTEKMFPGTKSLPAWGGQGRFPAMVTGPPSVVDECEANVSYTTAPANQFAALVRQWDAPGMGAHSDSNWQNAFVQRTIHQTAAAQQQNFERTMAVQQRMHEQFLDTMQRGTDMSMARAQANMDARSTAASDWVDYALDQRTVMDPNTGHVNKVSSAYSYTWVDSTGRNSYQTNNPSANPNGTLQGTWTQQQVVHGNGTQ